MATLNNTLTINTDGLSPSQVEKLREGVTELLSELEHGGGDTVLGWTTAAAWELCMGLAQANRFVQLKVIAACAEAGGKCDRQTVYKLGGYSDDRSLRGFTKPVARVMKQLVDKGAISPDAANPMRPIYDEHNPSFQQAQGFQMAAALAPVFQAILPKLPI